MIKISVYDDEGYLITSIENVNTMSYNPILHIFYITTLTGDMNNPYSFVTIAMEPGMYCKIER